MKILPAVLLCSFLAGTSLALQACALITSPIATTTLGGAQLAIKGSELEREIGKADVREAYESPLEKTWNICAQTLVDLDIEISKMGKIDKGNGGMIEGRAQKIKVKLVAVKLTEDITEIGIWAGHDKALAELIAEKIREGLPARERELSVPEMESRFLSRSGHP